LHTTTEWATVVGDGCVLGHLVHLECCTIEDDVLIGNAAMVLHRSVIRSGAVVAANSVVLNDVDVPSGALAAGSPALIKLDRIDPEFIRSSARHYVERIEQYRTSLRRLD
jgi:carbonic anhydrase/acetyltransferase-like protein (isoleucine patch superfamily)